MAVNDVSALFVRGKERALSLLHRVGDQGVSHYLHEMLHRAPSLLRHRIEAHAETDHFLRLA